MNFSDASHRSDFPGCTGCIVILAACLLSGCRSSTSVSGGPAAIHEADVIPKLASFPESATVSRPASSPFTPVSMQLPSLELDAVAVPTRTPPRAADDPPTDFRDLSEEEMLRIAFTSSPVLRPLGVRLIDNPAAAATIYDSAIDRSDPFFGPAAALAEFDSQLSAGLSTQNNDRVFNNDTLGGAVQELTQDLVNSNVGLQRRGTNGGVFQLGWQHLYDNNNRSANLFRNYYETQLQAGWRQPLLRGAGREFNLIAGPNAQPGFNFSNGIWIARLSNQVTDAQFQTSLQQFVQDLYVAYWGLNQRYREYEATLAAANAAEQTWKSVRARREAQIAGGEASKEAQARSQFYDYKRRVKIVLGGNDGSDGLYAAERQLRRLIGLPIVAEQILRPVDSPPEVPFRFDHEDLQARAASQRYELRAQELRVQTESLRLTASKNFLLPQVDAIGRYRLRGFGDDLTGDGAERFASAYKDFFSFDHQEWEFGVEMGVVAGRRQARAAVRQAQLKLQRARAVYREMLQDLRVEVADANANVRSAYATLRITAEQLAASRERLESSRALYEADQLRIEFLIDAERELLTSNLQYAADQTRYALALVNIGAVTGTLLQDSGVGLHQACEM